jgi:hypothetical protein
MRQTPSEKAASSIEFQMTHDFNFSTSSQFWTSGNVHADTQCLVERNAAPAERDSGLISRRAISSPVRPLFCLGAHYCAIITAHWIHLSDTFNRLTPTSASDQFNITLR